MTLNQLIETWGLNKSVLASKIGMPLGTFCNKLSPKHTAYFTPDELVKIHNVLAEMCKDIDEADVLSFETSINKLVHG